MPGAIEAFDLSDFDVVVSGSSAYAHGVITNLETRHICYYHSPCAMPGITPTNTLKNKTRALGELVASQLLHKVRQWDFLASGPCGCGFMNSKTVQDRIKKYYRKNSLIVHPPVQVERFEPHAKHEGYF